MGSEWEGMASEVFWVTRSNKYSSGVGTVKISINLGHLRAKITGVEITTTRTTNRKMAWELKKKTLSTKHQKLDGCQSRRAGAYFRDGSGTSGASNNFTMGGSNKCR